jgi:hypothetical protein
MSVTAKDARAVIKAILCTFRLYVCPGHGVEEVACDGTCMLKTALQPRERKSFADMDATPTLYDAAWGEVSKGNWSIAWEGGNAPDEWVFSDVLSKNVREATEGRVFVEPINNCILGVYPS